MTDTAAYALVLVLTGGPLSMLAPFVIARRLVERQAEQVATPTTDATPRTARKELISR
ncbi:hypothetical protein ACL02O_14725 [Micromonospora sp. MS34]|uniref:hypothetical protein n=1 Tax=Micromonospora sp. MS34 TaxID=3385971 RepID=UPI0039A2846F